MDPISLITLIGGAASLIGKGIGAIQGIGDKKRQQAYENEDYAKRKKEARQNAIARAMHFNNKDEVMMPYISPQAPQPSDKTFSNILQGVGNSAGAIGRFSQGLSPASSYQYSPQQSEDLTNMGFKYNPTRNSWQQGNN
jgi:hypothetical protein